MKYLLLLGAAAAIYFMLARHTPVAPVVEAVRQAEVAPLTTGDRNVKPATTAFKRPFDRTHEALEKVKTRNGDGEF